MIMNLIAWYPLDGDTNDHSGHGLDMTTVTASQSTNGKIGNCYAFASGNTIYRSSGLNVPASSTMCGWGYTPSYTVRAMMLFSLNSSAYPGPNLYFASSTILWNTGDGSNNPFKKDGATVTYPSVNAWHHYCVVNDIVGNKATLYIDGLYAGEAAYKSTYQVNKGMTIGNYYPGNTGYAWNGSINDVRVYEGVLSDNDIYEISRAKVLHYTFNDPQEPTVNEFNSSVLTDGYAPASVLQSSELDPFGLTGTVYRKTGKIRFGNASGVDVGTLYYGNTYTFSIYLRNVPNQTPLTSCEFDIVDRADSVNYTGTLVSNLTNEWKLFTVTALHNNNTSYHFIDIGHYGTSEVFEWCYPMLEKKDHATWYSPYGYRQAVIKDLSGFGHTATLDPSTLIRWGGGERFGSGCYDWGAGDVHDQVISVPMSDISEQVTVNCWAYQQSNGSNDNPLVTFSNSTTFANGWGLWNGYGTDMRWDVNGDSGYVSLSGMYDSWHMYTGTYNSITGIGYFYYDASLVKTFSLTAGTAISASGSDLYIGQELRNSNQSFSGRMDDVRVYATELDADYIRGLYRARARLDDRGGMNLIEGSERENRIRKIQEALDNKTFTDGLGAYTQTNCSCTLTNDGYNVYRPANLTYPADGNTMWGGVVLSIPEGTMVDGRRYQLRVKYRGVSSNGIKDMYFAYSVGWTNMGGLSAASMIDSIYTDSNRYQSIDTGGTWENIRVNISASEGQMYKVADNSTGGLIPGTTYYTARQFKIGHNYESTGVLGTNLYYKDFRLFDVTDGYDEEVSLSEDGIFTVDHFSEVGVTDKMVGFWKLNGDTLDYGINGYDATGDASICPGIKGQAYEFNGTNRIQVTDNPDIKMNGNFSLSFFMQGTTMYGSYPSIIEKGDATATGYQLFYTTVSNGTLYFKRDNLQIGLPNAVNSSWHHIVFTYDSSTLRGYVDGKIGVSQLKTYSTSTDTGYLAFGGGTHPSAGRLTDVRIYSRVLTEDEINILYKFGTGSTGMQLSGDGTMYLNTELKET